MQTSRPEVSASHVIVGGLKTARTTRAELAQVMVSDCIRARSEAETWRPRMVFSSNGQGIALAGRRKSFGDLMNKADIIHADGMSVVFASRLTSTPLPERISTTDFFHDAAEAAAAAGLRFFILGSTEAQNQAAVSAIEQRYPTVQIVGRHHGYFSEADDARVCALVRDSKADVLWVALGKPRQEEWCIQNRDHLQGVGWIKTCGGLYAFLAGDVSRAPKWMQRVGLEWLFRALEDPTRLGWRYLTTNPYAAFRMLRYTKRTNEVR